MNFNINDKVELIQSYALFMLPEGIPIGTRGQVVRIFQRSIWVEWEFMQIENKGLMQVYNMTSVDRFIAQISDGPHEWQNLFEMDGE